MLARRLAAEFLGTATLLATVVGSGIMGTALAQGNDALALLANAAATAGILYVLITVLGPVSGAHFNPAVTLAMLWRAEIGTGEAAAYVTVQAIAAIAEDQPDLMFLDIQMPGISGLDVVAQVPQESMPMVVFVTAFDRYAINAFEAHALDYLLKPVQPARLQQAMERVRERLLDERAARRVAREEDRHALLAPVPFGSPRRDREHALHELHAAADARDEADRAVGQFHRPTQRGLQYFTARGVVVIGDEAVVDGRDGGEQS